MKVSIFVFLYVAMAKINSFAGICSQAQIEQITVLAVSHHNTEIIHGSKAIIGRGTYEGKVGNEKGYFPVFFLDADCGEFGRPKCNMSSVFFADLATCSVISGPTNPNLVD